MRFKVQFNKIERLEAVIDADTYDELVTKFYASRNDPDFQASCRSLGHRLDNSTPSIQWPKDERINHE